MRCILMLALFFTCLSAASAADDPITKRNNDAGTRVPGVIPPVYRPYRPPTPPVVQPDDPEDLGPTK